MGWMDGIRETTGPIDWTPGTPGSDKNTKEMVGYQGTPKYWLPGNPIELPGYLGGLTLLGLLSSQEQAVWVVLADCNKILESKSILGWPVLVPN